jgi:hypothetical protein
MISRLFRVPFLAETIVEEIKEISVVEEMSPYTNFDVSEETRAEEVPDYEESESNYPDDQSENEIEKRQIEFLVTKQDNVENKYTESLNNPVGKEEKDAFSEKGETGKTKNSLQNKPVNAEDKFMDLSIEGDYPKKGENYAKIPISIYNKLLSADRENIHLKFTYTRDAAIWIIVKLLFAYCDNSRSVKFKLNAVVKHSGYDTSVVSRYLGAFMEMGVEEINYEYEGEIITVPIPHTLRNHAKNNSSKK